MERIEESVLQKLFKTTRSCSRHLLYLEAGIIPARFQVQRQVLNFLQYIVQQPQESLLYKVFKSLENHPTKKDWISGAKESLRIFNIQMTIENIREMKPSKFKNIVKNQAQKAAFDYLTEKQKKGKKGKLIRYTKIEMADYLLPECALSVENKTDLSAFRCDMNMLPNNFGKTELCEMSCKEPMNNEHLLKCIVLNEENPCYLELEQLRNGNISEKIVVLKKLQENSKRRTEYIRIKTQ